MNPVRRRKLSLVLLMVLGLGLVVALVLYALRQNISLFYTPTDISNQQAPLHRVIRVGGLVVPGSIIRGQKDLSVHFQLTDNQQTMDIIYHGVLPDLFREGQGVIAQGQLIDEKHFRAITVLAKHDENYMPPEVKAGLKRKS